MKIPSQNVTNAVDNFEFTTAALENIEETDTDALNDLAKIRGGRLTRESLLDACLNGANTEREQGWRDYVQEICRVAEKCP